MAHLLIIGASSDIAKSLARVYVDAGYDLYLAARDPDSIADLAKDIEIRFGSAVTCLHLDLLEFDTHSDFYAALEEKPAGVISVAGYMGNQQQSQESFDEARLVLDSNYTGVMSILNIAANDMEARRTGFIIGISSVAGDRGRQSNYSYGAAKAALTAYLSGLRNRLHKSGVTVVTVKPGYVATRMTADLDLPAALTADPDAVARRIRRAQLMRQGTVYTRSIWRPIMWLIRAIPERMFRRMRL